MASFETLLRYATDGNSAATTTRKQASDCFDGSPPFVCLNGVVEQPSARYLQAM
jgi:hypothetical protein